MCKTLAGHYRYVHVKDMKFTPGFHIHIDEAAVGEGVTDWVTAFKHIKQDLSQNGSIVLEHMKTPEQVDNSMVAMKSAVQKAGIVFD